MSASTAKIKIILPVGKRLDLASVVQSKLAVEFAAKMSTYMVQLTHGNVQRKQRVPGYLLLAQAGDEGVPVSIPALSMRAKSSEQIRLRCMSAECPLRPKEELDTLLQLVGGQMDKLVEAGAQCELCADDLQGGAGDEDAAEDEVGDRALEAEPEPIQMPGRRMPMDLWPFAFGKEYYKCLITSLSGSGAPGHVVLVSTSAHPAALLAMHDLGVKGHVLRDRVKRHAAAHGEAIMKKSLLSNFLEKERAKLAAAGQKRVLSSEIEPFVVQAPEEQPLKIWEAVQSKNSAWRAGMDNALNADEMDELVSRLLAKEVEEHESRVVLAHEDDGQKSVRASRLIKEGEVVGTARCLLFSDLRHVAEFLNQGENMSLLTAPVIAIHGLQDSVGEAHAAYAVLLGLAMVIRDREAVKGKVACANVFLRAKPEAGAGDGFLEMVVGTRTMGRQTHDTWRSNHSFNMSGADQPRRCLPGSMGQQALFPSLSTGASAPRHSLGSRPVCARRPSPRPVPGFGHVAPASDVGPVLARARPETGWLLCRGGFSMQKMFRNLCLSGIGLRRNFCGIARETELLFDFGSAVLVRGHAPAAKRFKGSLELYFAEQKKKQEAREEAERGEEQDPKRLKTDPDPTPGKTGKEGGSGEEKKKEEQKKKKEEQNIEEKKHEDGKDEDGKGATGAKKEDVVVCQFKKATLVVKAGKLVLRSEKGEKVANHKVLLKVEAGEMKESEDVPSTAQGLFSFESANSLVVDAADAKVMSIGALAKAKAAAKLFAHASFPKGSPPPKFARKKAFVFMPTDALGADARALEASLTASKVRRMWVVCVTDGKLFPKGVALVSTASIAAAAGDAEL